MARIRKNDESGATTVEMALVLPLVLLLVWGALYAGAYFYYQSAAAHVARVVARDASIPSGGKYPDDAHEFDVATNAGGSMLPKPSSVTLSPNPRVGEGNELNVTVTYHLSILSTLASLVPFPLHMSSDVTKTVTVRYE